MPLPGAIVFDLDGTLVDSLPGVAFCVRHTLREMGQREPDDDEMRRWIGPPLEASFSKALGVERDDTKIATALDHFRVAYAEHGVHQVEPFAGMIELVRELSGAGVRLVVGTTKSQHFARQIIDNLGLSVSFEHVAGRGEHLPGVKDEKIEVFESLLPRLGDALGAAVAVGDTRFDVVAGAAIGVPVIGVQWGFGTDDELTGCHTLVPTVPRLRAVLADWSV